MSMAVVEGGVTRHASFVSQGNSQVGFPEPHTAYKNHICLFFGEGKSKEVLDLGAVDFFGPAPVELFECLDDGKASRLDSTLGGSICAPQGLPFHQTS